MSFQNWINEILKGVVISLVVMGILWLPKLLKKKKREIKWISPRLIDIITKKWALIPILVCVLLFFAYIFWVHGVFFPSKNLIVALANFHLVSGLEEPDNKALISHLQDSLRVYKDDIELKDSVYPEVRDSVKARELGKKKGAHIVIWGSMEKTEIEAEIIPRITIVQSLGKVKLDIRQYELRKKISIAELQQIEFRKTIAREITDVILFILGLAKYKKAKIQESLEIFRKIQNKNAEILLYIGNAYVLLMPPDFKLAAESYELATKLDSSLTQAYLNWGVALSYTGDNEEAIEKFKKVVEVKPDYAPAYYNRGVALGNLGRYQEEIDMYDSAITLDPHDPLIYINWGVVLMGLGEKQKDVEWYYEQAIQKFELAVSIDQTSGTAHLNWGSALCRLGRYLQALDKFKRATEIDPRDAEAYSNWAGALNRLEKDKEAEAKAKKALNINPDLVNAYYELGVAQANLGKHKDAIEQFKEVITRNPEFARAHGDLGITFMKLGRLREAKKELLIARDLFKKRGEETNLEKVEELLKELEKK